MPSSSPTPSPYQHPSSRPSRTTKRIFSIASNISFTVIIISFISLANFRMLNIAQNEVSRVHSFYSPNAYSLVENSNNNNSNNSDNSNNNNNNNSSYYNMYDQYLQEVTSLRCTPLSEIFTFPDVIDNHTAVCEFQKHRGPDFKHFPHTMQQLYPCFSWWNNARNQNKSNVLIMKVPKTLRREFVNGFMTALLANNTSSFDLFVDKKNEYKKLNSSVHVGNHIDTYQHLRDYGNKPRAYRMHHPNDAKVMRQIILDYYNITASVVDNNNHFNHNNNNNLAIIPTAADEVECLNVRKLTKKQQQQQQQQQHNTKEIRMPVIGFLNRHMSSGRYITNHASIVKALEEELYPNNNNNNNSGNVITTTNSAAGVHYLSNFDGLSFQEQIAFMHKIDILIGPHGAQLTSVPFIPECGGILELFAPGHYIPDFFGSLSRATGHYHIAYYTGNITNRVEEVLVGSQKLPARTQSRSNNITNADPNVIIHGVKKLISNWQTCHCLTQVEKDACIW